MVTFGQLWSGRRLRPLLLAAVVLVSVIAVASAVAGRIHRHHLDVCKFVTAAEVSGVVRYTVISETRAPDVFDSELGADDSTCTYKEAHPKNASVGAKTVQLFLQQPDFSHKSSKWSAKAAKKQFAHLRTFEAPVVSVKGLGDAAMWSPSSGVLYVLSGDLILNISGQTGPRRRGQQVAASESADIALMRKALART